MKNNEDRVQKEQLPWQRVQKMEKRQYVLYRIYYITIATIVAVVLLASLDLQFTFLQWMLPSVATAAWVLLAVAAFLQVVLGPGLPTELRGRFTASYLAVRGAFVVATSGVIVWVIWSAYGPL